MEVLSGYRILLANVAFLNTATGDADVFSSAPAATADNATGEGGFAAVLALLTQDTLAGAETAASPAQENPETDRATGEGGTDPSAPAALVPAGIDAAMLMLAESANRSVAPDGGADATADDAATSGEDAARSDDGSTSPKAEAPLPITGTDAGAPQQPEDPTELPVEATTGNNETAGKSDSGPPSAGDGPTRTKDVTDDNAETTIAAAENIVLATLVSPVQAEGPKTEDGSVTEAVAAAIPPVAAEKTDTANTATGNVSPGQDETADGTGNDDSNTGDAEDDANAAEAPQVPIAAVAVAVQPATPSPANAPAKDGDTVLVVADAGAAPVRPQVAAPPSPAQTDDGGPTTDADSPAPPPNSSPGFGDVLKNEAATGGTDDASVKPAKTAPDAKTTSQSAAPAATGDAGASAQTIAQTAAPPSNSAFAAVAAAALPQAAGDAAVKPAVRIAVSDAANDDGATTNLQSLGLTIAAKSDAGIKHFEIGLSPPDLGRIEVKLSVGDDGSAKAVLIADKPQTLALLQNDAANLVRSLNDAGLNFHQNALSFSLRGDGGGGQNGGQSSYSGGGNLNAEAVADIEPAASTAPIFFSDGVRLDIRV